MRRLRVRLRHKQREPEQSVNFVTCHDGFTLNDLVTYNEKRNQPNGENNRDGCNDNLSWNCGHEGPTDDPAIEKLRNRQVKNFFAATLLSLGVPMITMGDEVRRTQHGNNNAYCHDDESTWLDWSLLHKHVDLFRFCSMLNARRAARDADHERRRLTLNQLIAQATGDWHGIKLGRPDWGDNSHAVAFFVELRRESLFLYLILNAYWEPLEFELPQPTGRDRTWQRWIDTALDSPNDISNWDTAPPLPDSPYRAAPRSVVVLVTRTGSASKSL